MLPTPGRITFFQTWRGTKHNENTETFTAEDRHVLKNPDEAIQNLRHNRREFFSNHDQNVRNWARW
jgi:hypothetical protein